MSGEHDIYHKWRESEAYAVPMTEDGVKRSEQRWRGFNMGYKQAMKDADRGMSKEAMKLALEFVEYHSKYWNGEGQHPQEIATALREALAEQPAQQEPAAWQNTAKHMEIVSAEDWENIDPMWHWMYRPLYPSPPAQQNPVAAAWDEGYRQGVEDEQISASNIGIAGFGAKVEPARQNPYGTTPPQRPWVGLTDEEIKRIGKLDLDSNYFGLWYDFAKAIEAKVKDKNI